MFENSNFYRTVRDSTKNLESESSGSEMSRLNSIVKLVVSLVSHNNFYSETLLTKIDSIGTFTRGLYCFFYLEATNRCKIHHYGNLYIKLRGYGGRAPTKKVRLGRYTSIKDKVGIFGLQWHSWTAQNVMAKPAKSGLENWQ